ANPCQSWLQLEETLTCVYAYASQRGKARRASPVRRLAKRNGSPTLPERKYSQTRQTRSSLGVAVVGRFDKRGWNARTQTGIGYSRFRHEHESAASTKSCRRASPSAESREDHALFFDLSSRGRGTVFHPDFLSHIEALHTAT